MAKKKGSGEMDDDYDFEDLGDLDEGLDLGDMDSIEADRNPSKAGIAKELSKEAASGFLDGLVKETARKSLPAEYDTYSQDVLDYANLGTEMFNSSKSRIEKSMFRLGNEVKKILHFQSKMLENFLNKYREDNTREQEASEEAMRDAGIQSNLTSIFDKQLEIQTAIEARNDAKDTVRDKQNLATTKLQSNILTSIDRNTAQQTAFTMQVSKEFFRRSLELQFKSYFVQADMLKTMKDYYKGFSVQFDSIVKNTGLPEFVKLTNTERLTEIARDRVTESVYKKLFSESDYVQGIKSKALSYVNTKVDEKLQGIDTMTDQLEMLTSSGESASGIARLLGSVFAGIGGGALGEKLAGKISPKIKDKISDNRYIKTGADQLALLGGSPTTFFANLRNKVNKKKEQYEDGTAPGSWLGSKVLGGFSDFLSVTSPEAMNYSVKKDSILDHGKPAIYTNKTDRAITEVIPMYLAKILQQNTNLTSMYSQVNSGRYTLTDSDELVYNYDERKLGTKSELLDSVSKNVLAKKGVKERTEGIASTLVNASKDTLNKDKKANKEALSVLNNKQANKLLSGYFEKANKTGVDMSFENLVDNALDTRKASPELSAIINEDPKLKEILLALQKGSSKASSDYTDKKLSDLNEEYPTSALMELIKQTSKIAGSKTFNIVDKKTASKLSKALMQFQSESNGDILPENVISGRALTKLRKQDFTPELKRTIGIFTNELKKILNLGGTSESAVLVLFGLLNKSLREAYELDPKVFQTLRDYSPLLGETGKLNNENLIERKLFRTKDTDIDLVDMTDLKSITRATKQQVEADRRDVLAGILGSNIVKGFSDFNKDLKAAGNDPRKLLNVATSHAKKAGAAISAKAEKSYKDASDKLKEVQTAFNNITEKTAKSTVSLLTTKLTEYAVSIDGVIEADKQAMEEKIVALNELKSRLSEASTDENATKRIDREIKIITAYYTDKIKVLTDIKTNLQTQQRSLQSLQESVAGKSATDLIKEVKDIVSSNLKKLEGLMEKAKAAEEKAAEAVS